MQALFTLRGRVIHGQGKGAAAGMPTANLPESPEAQDVKHGVYASIVTLRGQSYVGVTNLGLRPTVDSEARVSVETYIVGFSGDIYGEEMTLELFAYLRPTRRMASLSLVKAQVEKDVQNACRLLEGEAQRRNLLIK